MKLAKIEVTRADARKVHCDTLTAGMKGAEVTFSFDASWDGLNRIVTFKTGCAARDVLLAENCCEIPHEVLAETCQHLMVGIYGTNADGTLVIPTVWADLGTVNRGAKPTGDASAKPTPEVWAQILGMIGDLDDLNTDEKETLVAAINEVLSKTGGEVTEEEIEAAVTDYLERNPVSCGIEPVPKTEDMTQPVGVDENGQLWVAPIGGGSGDSGGSDDTGGEEVPTEEEIDVTIARATVNWTDRTIVCPVTSSAYCSHAEAIDATERDLKIVFPESDLITTDAVTLVFGMFNSDDVCVSWWNSSTGGYDETDKWMSFAPGSSVVVPKGYRVRIVANNIPFDRDNDKMVEYWNTARFFLVSGASAETTEGNTLSVDDDIAQNYGVSTLSLVTNTDASGIDSAYASVIETAKNAWMVECNGNVDKIPLIIHTDQHGNMTNNALFNFISKIVNWYDVGKVINLGDTIDKWVDNDAENPLTDSTAMNSYMKAVESVPFSKRIDVFGNHDTWRRLDSAYEGLTPQNYLHKYFRNIYARRADNYGNFVIYDDYYNVKYVVASGFAYDSSKGGYSHYIIHPDSVRWIVSELEKVDGYDVIILSHAPLGYNVKPTDPTTGEQRTYTVVGNNAVSNHLLTALWSGRKSKTSGTFTDAYGTEHAFDFTKCDGELLCGLHGHMHEDGYYYVDELLDVYFDAYYIAPKAFFFVLVDRENRRLNVWKVDDSPQCQNYQIPMDKPAE